MEKENKRNLCVSICMLAAFLLWTVAVRFVDVQAIGPRESSVGFATVNRFIHELTGVNWTLYTITDWLGLVPIAVAFGFAVFGLVQLIRRKSLHKVDHNLLVLGAFYTVVIAVYVFFETVVINYRPTLIEGYLEASYPSSTTMLVTCVMPTAVMQFNVRIKNGILKRWLSSAITVFIAFMVIGRLASGVHWFTDIVGGALLSIGLVLMYRVIIGRKIR